MPTYEPATLVVSTDYTPERHTLGVLVDGAFVPVTDWKSGHVAQAVNAVDPDDPHVAANGSSSKTGKSRGGE